MTWVACKLNNFTKNEYIIYIIGKSLEGIFIYIFKFLTDFRVCFHGAKVGNMQLLPLSHDVSIFPGQGVNFCEQAERANIHSMSIYLLYL